MTNSKAEVDIYRVVAYLHKSTIDNAQLHECVPYRFMNIVLLKDVQMYAASRCICDSNKRTGDLPNIKL